MKQLFLALFIIPLFFSCAEKKTNQPANALEAGRSFIRASLNGDFTTAESLILQDSSNNQSFQRFEQYYQKLPNDDKNKYASSSFEINKYTDVNDSTALINYSNSYMKQAMEIKLVKKESRWLVDFKHTVQ